MGLLDEYVDPATVLRGKPGAPGVHDDDSLMGNFWTHDAHGNPIPRPGTELKPRHTGQIGGDIDNATAKAGGQRAPGQTAPGPRANAPESVSDAERMAAKLKRADENLPGELEKRSLADKDAFKDLDPQTRVKVNDALSDDPLGTQKDLAQQWALGGAKGNPREFANRYEYAKAKFNELKRQAPEGLSRNARKKLAQEKFDIEDLDRQLKDDLAAAGEQGPRQRIDLPEDTDWQALAQNADALGGKVRKLDHLDYESPTAEAYHIAKHAHELPDQAAVKGVQLTGDPRKDFLAMQQHTIQTGKPVTTGELLPPDDAVKIVFTQSYGDKTMQAIVFVRPNGKTSIATFMTAN